MKAQRNANSPRLLSVREMKEADLELLRQPSKRVGVKSIRDSHHAIARHFASGAQLHVVAELTGYSIGRLSVLRSDPSMKDLIERYRAIITEEWREEQDVLAKYATKNMLKAERMISDKLDEADELGETLPMRELLAITSDRMDRFGYGKKTANLNVNVDFAAKLEAAIARTKRIEAE